MMEDQPDPGQASSYYHRHLKFFEIQPENKTIKTVVTELKAKVRENFIRKCHYQPETYNFKDFRRTRSYRLYREYLGYLKKLSSWLYRESNLPISLKKVFSRSHTFVNPYQDFCLNKATEEELSLLNNLMLSVVFNLNICTRFPSKELRKNVLREFKKRKVDTSEVEKSTDILVEVISLHGRDRLVLLREDRDKI